MSLQNLQIKTCQAKTVCAPSVAMNVESYRRRAAIDRKHGAGRPAHYATPKNTGVTSPPEKPHRAPESENPAPAQEDGA